jgi:hypothetical protein
MAGLTTVTNGLTYVVDGGITYLVSAVSTVITATPYSSASTISGGPRSGQVTYVAPVIETSIIESSIGATAPAPAPVSTTATTSVFTSTTPATFSTTSAIISTTSSSLSSTIGFSNGTVSSSGPAVPTHTKVVTVPSKDTGKVAGVAVACLIGGALIAGLLTWLIMSSRQKKKSRSSGGFGSDRNRLSRSNNEKALPSAPLLGGGVVGNWEKHLDQPESDNTIARSVKGLFDLIEVHVENYYRDAQVKITPELQNALMKVEGSNDLPDSIAGLLPNAQRPTMLIKHSIAHSIIEHIDSESDISDSFLPTDFIALPQALRTRRTTANKPGKLSLPSYTQPSSRSKLTESQHTIKPTHAGASSVPTSAPNPPKTQTIQTHETASSRPWLIGCAACLIHGPCHPITLALATRI